MDKFLNQGLATLSDQPAEQSQDSADGKYAKLFGAAHRIRFAPEHALDGFKILFATGGVEALPEETYVISSMHLMLLNDASVPYEVLDDEQYEE